MKTKSTSIVIDNFFIMTQLLGVGLIILIVAIFLLWIWYTKNQKGVEANEAGGVQAFDVLVKGVYSPAVIRAGVGRPVRINFRREESTDCSRFVSFPDFKIRKELPQNETISIEFTPDKKGEFLFTCDMSMYQGKLIVE